MARKSLRWVVLFFAVASGCNAILGNEEKRLAPAGGGSTSSGGSNRGGSGSGGDSSGGDSAGGDSNGGVGDTGTAGDGQGGGEPIVEDCTVGEACETHGVPGLCQAGLCQPCSDPDDDAACQEIYGAGHLCLAGECRGGDCRVEADCTNELCIDNHCTGCTRDADCSDPTPICNIGTGECVDAKQCDSVAEGMACPVNEEDTCCGTGPSAACVAGCCTDDNCAADESCVAGQCISDSCGPAPTDHHYYVDPTAEVDGPGTLQCPIRKLSVALGVAQYLGQNLTDTVTITLLESIDAASEGAGASDPETAGAEQFPFSLPSNVNIEGQSLDTVVTTPAGKSGFVVGVGPNTISDLTIRPEVKDLTIHTSGIRSNGQGASLVLSGNILIENLYYGINVYAGDTLTAALGAGESLVVQNGENGVRVLGHALISTTGGSVTVHANNEGFGVSGLEAQLTLTGEPLADEDDKSIVVTNSIAQGIRFADQASGDVTHVGITDGSTGTGFLVYPDTKPFVSNCFIARNEFGVELAAQLGSLAGINFGRNPGQGLNHFISNTTAICVRADGGSGDRTLVARYNTFALNTDCTVEGTDAVVGVADDCEAAARIGIEDGSTVVAVDYCGCRTDGVDSPSPCARP